MLVLCWFLHHNEYNSARIDELEALALLEGLQPHSLWAGCNRPDSTAEDQFVFIQLPSEAFCHAIMRRSILIRAFIEVWASGSSYEEVLELMKTEEKHKIFKQWINKNKTFAFRVAAFGKSLSSELQQQKMNFFSSLFEGNETVCLSHPDTTLVVAEQWTHTKQLDAPMSIYFGREICRKLKEPPFWWRYRLPVRPVLGPTSLDCELAFIMCNQGLVAANSVVFDPFVGTGGLLIAAAHHGAFCFGSDIDIRVLKGYGVSYLNPHLTLENKRTDIFRNFEDYGLRRPEIIRSDNAAWVWRLPFEGDRGGCSDGSERASETKEVNKNKNNNNISNKKEKKEEKEENKKENTKEEVYKAAYLKRNIKGGKPWVDCIITDPPYGIRAGARQSGHTKKYKRDPNTRSNEE